MKNLTLHYVFQYTINEIIKNLKKKLWKTQVLLILIFWEQEEQRSGKEFPFATARSPSVFARWLSSLALPDCGRETMPARSSSLASGKFLSALYRVNLFRHTKQTGGKRMSRQKFFSLISNSDTVWYNLIYGGELF